MSFTDCEKCLHPETCEHAPVMRGNQPLRRFTRPAYRALRHHALGRLVAVSLCKPPVEPADAELCIRELQRWCSAAKQFHDRFCARDKNYQPDETLAGFFQDAFRKLQNAASTTGKY